MSGSTFARQLRKRQTASEARLWYLLRNRGLGGLKFRRQYPHGPYVADFCCVAKKLIVELDGGQHQERKMYDTNRSNYFRSMGFVVLRFLDSELWKEEKAVLNAIAAVAQSPHP